MWLIATVWFGWVGDGDVFPRLGAGLIAIVAIYFAFLPNLNINPVNYGESNKLTSLTLNLHSKALQDNRQNTGVLAASIANVLRSQNVSPPESICHLAELASNEMRQKADDMNWEENSRKIIANADQILAADSQVAKAKSTGIHSEAVFIAVGTLQWGFGDLVSCWGS